MKTLGAPKGIFSLSNSDRNVGSFFSKEDAAKVLNVPPEALPSALFVDGFADERVIQNAWYAGQISGAASVRMRGIKSSFDELVLHRLIEQAFPTATIERQVAWGRRSLDFIVDVSGTKKIIDLHGPCHFAPSRYAAAPEHPAIRKQQAEDAFDIEYVIWPYWMQRCEINVRAVFDPSTKGLGALWSTNVHFGDFIFEDSADVIRSITQRFNAYRDSSIGYFYRENSEGRDKPAHPILKKGKIDRLLPKGFTDPKEFLP